MCAKIMGIFRMYKVFNKNISNKKYFRYYIADTQYFVLNKNRLNIFSFL